MPLAIAVSAAWVAWSADDARWSALVLHAEPFLLVAAAVAAYGAAVTRRPAYALGVFVGSVAAVALVRLPDRAPHEDAFAGLVDGGDPSEDTWLAPAARCAQALPAPADDVRVLLWTVDDAVPIPALSAVVDALEPDVTVLHGVQDPALADAVRDDLGGETIHLAGEGGGRGAVVHTRGVFHLCGEDMRWGEAEDSPTPLTLLFVGTTPDTTFPLLLGRLPGPWEGAGWSDQVRGARARLVGATAGLHANSTVVALDAAATWTYRHLDGALTAAGVAPLAVPPSWPSRIGPLRMLPLHPYDRAWAGPAWRLNRSWRLDAPAGPRAPVLLELSPAAATVEPPATPGGGAG